MRVEDDVAGMEAPIAVGGGRQVGKTFAFGGPGAGAQAGLFGVEG